MGGFYVPFTSQHGGTLSSPQFTVSSNHSAVAIVFSDTNGSSSNSDSAELIARIFIPPLKVVSAKLNDDARADVLETALINGKLALRTHLSDGTGGFTTSDWYETGDIYKEGSRFVDVVVADVNGDGVDDIIHVRTDSEKLIFRVHVSDGTGGFTTLPWYRTGDVDCIGACFVQVLVADVNGDGRQDLVHVRTKNNRLIWRVHLANGSGGFSQRPWYQTGDQYCAGACFVQVVVADINGDGRQDLVHARTKNNRLMWRVHLANSSGGFSRQLWYQTGDQYCTDSCFVQVLVADVNGDGRQDLVHVRTDNQYLLWRVHMTDSSNSFSPQPWYRTSDQYAEDVARVGTFAAHLDSNNRNDVVHWRTDGGKIIVRSHLADLNGNFIATSQWYRTGELFAEDASRYGLLSADMDGDGLTDLLHWRTDEGFLILKAHFANGIGSYQSGSWYRAP